MDSLKSVKGTYTVKIQFLKPHPRKRKAPSKSSSRSGYRDVKTNIAFRVNPILGGLFVPLFLAGVGKFAHPT